MKTYIGIDNGVTGTIGIVSTTTGQLIYAPEYHKKPTYQFRWYTKETKYRKMVDMCKYREIVEQFTNPVIIMERPFVNPKHFITTTSAVMCFQSEIILFDQLEFKRPIFLDSKAWQKLFLPKGTQGSKNLKHASKIEGIAKFPYLELEINKHGDADGLFIALYGIENNL